MNVLFLLNTHREYFIPLKSVIFCSFFWGTYLNFLPEKIHESNITRNQDLL